MTDDLFWADKHAKETMKRKKRVYVCAAGVTPSGPKHVGSFREVITSYFIAEALRKAGKKSRLIYSWDSFDRFRKVPADVPASKRKLMESMIGKPVSEVIDPWGCHKTWADHWMRRLEDESKLMGINAEFIYQHEMYGACKYAENIKKAMNERETINRILSKYRKEPLPSTWYPLKIYCKKCCKDFTKVLSYDGEYTVEYECKCGFKGKTNFSKEGNVKLPWRVDWPMRWLYEGVDFEPAGKDHMVAGSSYDTGKMISYQVFAYEPPYGIMYDFVGAKGGAAKMSASKGNVIFVSDLLKVYLPEVILYMFTGTKPNKEMRVSFDEDVFKIYEDFYQCEAAYYDQVKGLPDKRVKNLSRIYEYCVDKPRKVMPVQLGFRTAALIVQSAKKKDWLTTVKELVKVRKTDEPRINELLERAVYWVEHHAPEQYKFIVNKKKPKIKLDPEIKKALKELGKKLLIKKYKFDELNSMIFELARPVGMRDFFKAAYQVIINKDQGPKLAQFIITAGQERIGRLLSSLS